MSDEGTKNPSDPQWREVLLCWLIANDTDYKLWPANVVANERNRLTQDRELPSLEMLEYYFGKEPLHQVLGELVAERAASLSFEEIAQGTTSPCHVCGANSKLTYHDFGLANITKEDWKRSVVSAAVSAVSVPLLGAGALVGPSKTARILRMRLVLCEDCVSKRKNIFGAFVAGHRDCASHPLWAKAQEAGFTKFIGGYDLKHQWG